MVYPHFKVSQETGDQMSVFPPYKIPGAMDGVQKHINCHKTILNFRTVCFQQSTELTNA